MRIRVSRKSGTIGAAIAVAALVLGAGLPAQASNTGWRVAFHSHCCQANDYSIYGAIVATSGDNAWALGGADSSGGGTTSQVEGAHWTGSSWHTVSMPAGVGSYIDAASAPAADDIWAVTAAGGKVLHYNGKAFAVAHTFPSGDYALTGVTALSPTNVWTFGNSGAGPGYGTYHYNGVRWAAVSGAGAGITAASPVTPSSIWAFGSDGTAPQNAILHFNGKTWNKVVNPVLDGLTFTGVAAVSATSVWFVGNSHDSTTGTDVPYLLHYNGTGISKARIPPAGPVDAVAPDGQGGVWMNVAGGPPTGEYTVYHVTSWGLWNGGFVYSGSVRSLTAIPGTTAIWGSGSGPSGSSFIGDQAYIWAYGTP